jgi:hypothetical protein
MTDARFPPETACRLSRSVLWRLQRRFAERSRLTRRTPARSRWPLVWRDATRPR